LESKRVRTGLVSLSWGVKSLIGLAPAWENENENETFQTCFSDGNCGCSSK
jgi:hypothetical protein